MGVIIPVAAVLLVAGRFLLLGRQSRTAPAGLGVTDGKLAPCSRKPNCVSDQAADDGHRIAPLPDAWDALQALLASEPRTTIVERTANYLHAEARSALFGFVDDVEFLRGDGKIHVRSASRVGTSDLGVNRKRIEFLRSRLRQ